MITFVTFGQTHVHSINGKTFDKDCVAVVNGDRDNVFEIFGPKFCMTYSQQEFDPMGMKYYPRGYIAVK